LKHRIKNSFAITQSIVNQTLRSGGVSTETRRALTGRLQAMAEAHDEIAKGPWEGASLLSTAARVCRAFGSDWNDRISIAGDDIDLPPRTVLSFSLLFHELLTNATKYGALAEDDGQVVVRIERTNRDSEWGAVSIQWEEKRSAPLMVAAGSTGFGTRLMNTVVTDLHGTIERDFTKNGLICRILVPDGRLAQA
jgi:two-component sensor histidine kinase